MSTAEWVALIAIVPLTLFAALLALAETSLTHMSRARASALAEEDRRGAAVLTRLISRPARGLNPVLLLLVSCHLAVATIVGAVVARRVGGEWVPVALVAEVLVIYLVAEAAPKSYALGNPDRAALFVAPVVDLLARMPLLASFARGLNRVATRLTPGGRRRDGPVVSEEELLALADAAAVAEVIEDEERDLIESIIEFGDTVVREVMVPRTDMVTVAADSSSDEALQVVIDRGFSRIPVSRESVDDICGLAYAKDLMRAQAEGATGRPIVEIAREARFVPATKRVSELMREMQAHQFHMAIVVDEYGGTAGLVTLEDLIEELVGEIVDEYDVEDPLIEPAGDGGWRVNARMPVDEVNSLVGADLPEGDWDTIGGLVYNLAGHVPTEGETVDVAGFRLRAERVQGRRIGRVRLRPMAPVTVPEGDSAEAAGSE